MNIFTLAVISVSALIPSFFWLWIYRLQDKQQPEPRSLIARLFFAGILITVPAVFLEWVFIPSSFYQSYASSLLNLLALVILTAVIEEFLKFLVTKMICWKLCVFDQVIDGVIYSISVALGFALIENFLYFLPFVYSNQNLSNFTLALPFQEIQTNFWAFFFLVFFSRFIFTTLMHTLSSGAMGLYLSKARFDSKSSSKLMIKGLLWAIAFHSVFNFFALLNQVIFNFFITIIFAIYFFISIRKKEYLKIRLARKENF